MCICVIPARGGSTRIPRKNIKYFHGKPIIVYSIETAQKAGIFDAIFVSTDDDEIAEISAQFGAHILWRDEYHSRNDVGTQEVMRDALKQLTHDNHGDLIEFACCLYATAPMLHPETIVEAYDILQHKLISDTHYADGMFFGTESNVDYVVPVATWLRDPGQFYFGRVESFLSGVDLIGNGTILIKTDPKRECDINTPHDWVTAERMYKELLP